MTQVRDNAREGRYELVIGGKMALAAYSRQADVLVFTHTEVPVMLRHQGVGGQLIAGAFDDARRHGLKIRPACAFVATYVELHPEYRDLVAGA
jgi:predicted GNAT family acetyltransferase